MGRTREVTFSAIMKKFEAEICRFFYFVMDQYFGVRGGLCLAGYSLFPNKVNNKNIILTIAYKQ